MSDQLSNSLRDSFNITSPVDPNVERHLDLEAELKKILSTEFELEIQKELAALKRST